MPIRSSENAAWRCLTISGSPISSESSGAKRLVWLSSEELIILGLVVLEELDMSESVIFSDGAKGVKVS